MNTRSECPDKINCLQTQLALKPLKIFLYFDILNFEQKLEYYRFFSNFYQLLKSVSYLFDNYDSFVILFSSDSSAWMLQMDIQNSLSCLLER